MSPRTITPLAPEFVERLERLVAIRRGMNVQRWHGTPTLGVPQTVAAHSAGVAVCALWLYPDATAALVAAAVLHDAHEYVVGDIPYTAKRRFPDIKTVYDLAERSVEIELGLDGLLHTLSPEDQRRLRVVDMAELLLYCLEQRALGNTNMDGPFWNGVRALRDLEPALRGYWDVLERWYHDAVNAVTPALLEMRRDADA